jgi:NNMT/PNMT/TEMT family
MVTTPSTTSLNRQRDERPYADDRFGLALPSMVHAPVRNREAPWPAFSPEKYFAHNYESMLSEDQEIIRRVGLFFTRTFAERRRAERGRGERGRAERAIDVGSGTNLYPALLMLPWADHIQLADYSPRNVSWLRDEVLDEEPEWAWWPFWQEVCKREDYKRISEPRKQLKQACFGNPEKGGVKQRSVFDLPSAQWQLGTMFFVAESITEEFDEFSEAIEKFVGALQPRAPFAAAFMAESKGYEVDGTWFPALPVTVEDVRKCFEECSISELNVVMTETPPEVRPGYNGMIVATGIVGGR